MAKKFLLYIHEDEKFSREKNKSELINNLLEKYYSSRVEDSSPTSVLHPMEEPSAAELIADIVEAQTKPKGFNPLEVEAVGVVIDDEPVKDTKFTPQAPDPETGYPCCTKATPCKHWTWNGTENYWINTLTGKVKEV